MLALLRNIAQTELLLLTSQQLPYLVRLDTTASVALEPLSLLMTQLVENALRGITVTDQETRLLALWGPIILMKECQHVCLVLLDIYVTTLL